MKQQSSTKKKITLAFSFTFALICMFFILSLYAEIVKNNDELKEHQKRLLDSFMTNYQMNGNYNISTYIQNSGFKLVKDKNFLEVLKKNGELYYSTINSLGEFYFIAYKDKLYLWLKHDNYDSLFYINRAYISFEFIAFGFVLSMFFFILLYFAIVKYLNPLTILSNQVEQIIHGKHFPAYKYEDDEIGRIAIEFFHILDKNNELLQSRQFFLRAIMHELKTPIGKGMIASSMLNDEKQKTRFMNIFKRLNLLVDESARIENLFSKNYKLDIQRYSFAEILTSTKDLLMLDDFDNKVKVSFDEKQKFLLDLEMISLVLKNLIDNALKYSDDKSCILECFNSCITVKNKAKPLKKKMSDYTKAFISGEDNDKKGFGLGLYIVEQVCLFCDLKLSYEYENSYHCFKITKA